MRALACLALVAALGIPAGVALADEPPGATLCAGCHEDAVQSFRGSPHGTAIAARGDAAFEGSCAACHTPTAAHLESPGPNSVILRPGDAACAACHPSSSTLLSMGTPAHIRFDVRCLDCHASGHGAPLAAPLLRADSVELCGGCHAAQRRAFDLPYAHRESSRRPLDCRECHAVHARGSVGRAAQVSAKGACVNCHTEYRGPFLFAHAPVETDGCTVCHAPHGSPYPRQMARYRPSDSCVTCHANIPAFHRSPKYRNCIRCHTAVHGSNHDPALLEE